MTIKPLFDKVVVESLKAEEKTKSGLYLTAAAQEKPVIYKVIATGQGGLINGSDVKMQVKAGDKVLIDKLNATHVKVEEKEYIILSQNDILAIVE